MNDAPAYSAVDRSILLPLYKRAFVDPVLPRIPAWVHPNWITHVGHAVCLAAMLELAVLRPSRGTAMLVGLLLLQLYLLCDNVDGAHARRTSQSSAVGEYLDHGLDLFNSSYIGVMATVALATTGTMTVVLTALVSGAASITCWEQAETGVFRLGLLNQIESVWLVTVLLAVSALDSSAFWATPLFGPVTRAGGLVGFSCLSILVGIARGVIGVRAKKRPVAPPLVLLAYFATTFVGTFRGDLPVLHAVLACLSGSIALGWSMLAARLRSELPRTSWVHVCAVVLLGAAVVLGVAPAAALVLTAVFTVLTVRDVHATFARLW